MRHHLPNQSQPQPQLIASQLPRQHPIHALQPTHQLCRRQQTHCRLHVQVPYDYPKVVTMKLLQSNAETFPIIGRLQGAGQQALDLRLTILRVQQMENIYY